MIVSERHHFDIPAGIAYFNCAYNAPQLNITRDALLVASGSKSHPWKRMPTDFFDDAETIRGLAASLFGGDADGFAIIPAASYGISAAARAIEPHLVRGDEILIPSEEFPSNYLAWHRAAANTEAKIVVANRDAEGSWTSTILSCISPRTKVVALGHCHWTNGSWIDLEAVAKASRSVGAWLVVDATQSLGAMPLNLEAIGPDFLVASGYKWLLCPYGFSLMYVAPRWRTARPLEESWLARENARDFAKLADYSDVYLSGARRFDVGEKCTTLLPGAIAALSQLKAWSIPGIATRLRKINNRIADYLGSLNFDVPPSALRCPHMIGVQLPQGINADFVGALRGMNVFVSQRADALRFAPHLHVTEEDLEQLFSSIKSVMNR